MKSKLIFAFLIFTVMFVWVLTVRFQVSRRFGEVTSDLKLISLYQQGSSAEFEKTILSKGWGFERIAGKEIDQKSSPDLPKVVIIPVRTYVSDRVLTRSMTDSMKELVPKIVLFRNEFNLVIPFFDLNAKKSGYIVLVPIFS